MAPTSKSSSSSPSKSKSTKSSSSKSPSSRKPSKHDSDDSDDHDRPSSSRRSSSSKSVSSSSSSSKKPEKKEKTSLLKSMFTKDRSDAPRVLEPKYFKDESSKAGKSERLDSAMFRDESRAPSLKKGKSERLDSAMFRDESENRAPKKMEKEKSEKVKSEVQVEGVKYKSEKKKVERVKEEEEYTEEPDFSEFVSKYEMPEEVKKVENKQEKKVEKSAKPEVNKSEVVKSRYESVKVEPSAKYESAKYESVKAESKVKSVANFKTTFTDDHDIEMAAKQTQIAELTGEELKEQEKWAFEKLKAHAGSCPAGFSWVRYTEEACGKQVRLDGYRCKGGSHLVTHEMIAEGQGGVWNRTLDFLFWEGDVSEAEEPGSRFPMPPPFTGLRWEIMKDEDIDPRPRVYVGSLGAPLSGPARQQGPSNSALFGRVAGGRGSRGMGISVYDPFGRFNLPQGTADRLRQQQHQQPGGGPRRPSVLDPNYPRGQPDDENDQQQSGVYGGLWGNGGQGGMYGGGYNGGGGGGGGWKR